MRKNHSTCSPAKTAVRITLFLLILGTRTFYNILSIILTTNTMNRVTYCMLGYPDKRDIPGWVTPFNYAFIFLVTTFSTNVMLLSRWQKVWKRSDLTELMKEIKGLRKELPDCWKCFILPLMFVGFFGILASVARAIAGYAVMEVVLGEHPWIEKWPLGKIAVGVVAIISAAIVSMSSILFHSVNMLNGAAKIFGNPGKFLKGKENEPVTCWLVISRSATLLSVIVFGILPRAIAMRFFIKTFLDRRVASLSDPVADGVQITGQSVFFVAELVMGLFTMGSSFEGGWFKKFKEFMSKGTIVTNLLFSLILLPGFLSLWYAYSNFTIYDISVDMVDLFSREAPFPKNSTLCFSANSNKNIWLHRFFYAFSSVFGFLSTIAYYNYILSYSKASYIIIGKKVCPCLFKSIGIETTDETDGSDESGFSTSEYEDIELAIN